MEIPNYSGKKVPQGSGQILLTYDMLSCIMLSITSRKGWIVMPSDTFFRLPEEKRQRFLDAAWKEFTSYSYMDASINRIIQEAKVSRGSFYQYFSGKHDLFLYLLKTLIPTISQGFLAQMTAHGANIFEAILGMFDLILWQSASPREDLPQARIGQLFRLNADLEATQFIDQLDLSTIGQQTRELLEKQGCQIADNEVQAVLFFILAAGFSNLLAALRCPNQQDLFREQLRIQLDILRKGLTPSQERRTPIC